MDGRGIDELIRTIHSVALTEDGWSRIGNALCRALGATGGSLVRPTAVATVKAWCRLFEFDPIFMTEYTDHWAPHDVWYQGAVRTRRIGVGLVNLDGQLTDYRDYKRSPFYNEYLRPMGIDRMMNVCLAEPRGAYGPFAMSFYRGIGRESFSAEDAALLAKLAPHLTVASHNHWSAQSLRLLARARGSALDALTSALFGLDSSGRVTLTNRAAEEILKAARWIQSSADGLSPGKGILEARSLSQTLRQPTAGISFRVIITDGLTGAQAVISGAPLGACEPNAYPESIAALVWLTPIVPNAGAASDLAKLFRLTLAETRLVGRLIAGDDLRTVAMSLDISPHTARAQLKSIFNKTGLRTQAALLTFVARLSSVGN